jgi:hypothetical protein
MKFRNPGNPGQKSARGNTAATNADPAQSSEKPVSGSRVSAEGLMDDFR